jgi:hypothetical protein
MDKLRLSRIVSRAVFLVGVAASLGCPNPRNEPVMEPGLNPPGGGARTDGGGSSGMNRGQDGPEPSNQVCGSACEAEKSDGCCPVGCTAASDVDCASQCGNGVIEKGEECDPPSSCPASCPNRGCTKFTLDGDAATCTALCRESGMQAACQPDDGCCPTGCTGNDDNDCLIMCGNGTKEGSETCDPLASCPSTCPQEGCQLRKLVNAGTCTAECVNDRQQTMCVAGDGCCPPGCHAGNDGDCLAACDNGVKESGEACDPLSSCPTTCPANECQLRKLVNGGTCKAQCVDDRLQTTCTAGDDCCPPGCNSGNDSDCAVKCGNGVKEAGETCDPLSSCPGSCPNMGCQLRELKNPGTCKAVCENSRTQTACASGDDCCPSACHNNNDTDCDPRCGNGVVERGETCEPAAECTRRQTACKSDRDTIRTGRGNPGQCTFECAESPRTCGDADGQCPSGCANDPDCKRANGSACDNAGQCLSGRCTDGRCCAGTCGPCERCTGAQGTCQLPSGVRVCGSQCKSTNECCQACNNECSPCDAAANQCRPRNNMSCDGGQGTCNASGTCVPNCRPMACQPTNECTTSMTVCPSGQCRPTHHNGRSCMDGNGTCNSSGTCVPNCGAGGQVCCDNRCNNGFICNQDSGRCEACGEINQMCCPPSGGGPLDGDRCKAGAGCNNGTSRPRFCEACGSEGQACCTATPKCQGNLQCISPGFCTNNENCGQHDQPCCAGRTCDDPDSLFCNGVDFCVSRFQCGGLNQGEDWCCQSEPRCRPVPGSDVRCDFERCTVFVFKK